MEAQKAARFSLGWKVIAGLAALTLVEYWVAATAQGPLPYPVLCFLLAPITWISIWALRNPLPLLGMVAVLKAALILYYFMHVTQVWTKHE